jgi:hypothetical protein
LASNCFGPRGQKTQVNGHNSLIVTELVPCRPVLVKLRTWGEKKHIFTKILGAHIREKNIE